MRAQQSELEDVYDLIAFRVVVESVSDCYAALGVIHSQWTPVPGRFKDYIALPEAEHVPVAPHDGHRPGARAHRDPDPHHEMHRVAERGIAAHWKYKERGRRDRRLRTRSASAGCASSSSGRRS